MRLDWLVTGLHVTGGAEMYVRRMAPLLRQAGWDLHVVTFVSGGNLVDELRIQGVPVIELGMSHRMDISVLARLVRLWGSAPPDIIHTHLFHAGLIGRILARRLGIAPVVVHQHGLERARSFMRSFSDRATALWVTRYVASCKAVAQFMTSREHIQPSRIEVVYNGIDPAQFILSSPSVSLPPGWSVPKGAKVVGTVGRLSPEKGHDCLLEAESILIRQGMELHIVLVGEGRSLADLKDKARRLGISEQVHFPGARLDVPDWLANFDLFALPSEWEGVSLALLEAMASGLAIVATDSGGTPEIVLDGKTGLLIPPGNPRNLADGIQHLMRDTSLRIQMGQAGRARVMENFSILESVARLSNLYQELLP